ncbi:MAG: glutaredoxin family protein [Acidobacteriia bacterium]|nr:glutaredoxin family protein [Terriglobia bacterium]
MVVQDWLLPAGGGDFFLRTELGRLAIADRKQVTLLTRKGCHLCEVARARVEPVLAELGAQLRLVDVDSDPVLHERYTEDVPVIFAGPVEVSRHRADLESLRRAILGPAGST